jgi:hypothetical protein
MTAEPEGTPTPETEDDPEENRGIAAAYTYLGQFADHDITFDPTSQLRKSVSREQLKALVNFRTPRFDLDNLYARGPDDQPYMYQPDGLHMLLGEPMSGNPFDPAEIYSPPYVFGPARPTIGQVATEWNYGQAVDIATPDAGGIMWAELVRYGVTTHAFDNSQRLVDLPITARPAGGLAVNAPAAPTMAPPGWYMLFLVDDQQIPSVATPIHLS